MIETIIIILLILYGIFITISEVKQKFEIALLKGEIEALVKYKRESEIIDETMPPNVQLLQLKNQAEMLKFCFQCPLYQDKVREDK